jgi:predicted ATP-grasp superfamily ATP-dependent carboligase
MAAKKKIPAVCLLAETLGHPAYLGMRGARELVEVLNKKLALNINMSELDKEIQDIENEILERSEELMKRPKKASLKKIQGRMQKETQYIG